MSVSPTAVRDTASAERLRRLVERNAAAGSLAEGALLIAREHYPDLDIDHYLARLDTLGAMLKAQVPDDADDVERILVLNRFLFEEQGFGPNQDDFAERIRAAGFGEVNYWNYSGGIAALHTGWAV